MSDPDSGRASLLCQTAFNHILVSGKSPPPPVDFSNNSARRKIMGTNYFYFFAVQLLIKFHEVIYK